MPSHHTARKRRVVAYHLTQRSRQGLFAGVGGGVALLTILWVSSLFVGNQGAGLLVASMGASAVLLFSAPEAPLSQPWNLVVGQLVSALVGVTCAKWLGVGWASASAAVALAIATMAILECTHPPGGATALSAVVGGPAVTDLGYQFVLTPVAINSLLILTAALAFHFPARNYPVPTR